jgi:DNA-binding SARP family transcriptional activator
MMGGPDRLFVISHRSVHAGPCMLSLRLFGGLSLEVTGDDTAGAIPVRATQRRRLALLAVLASGNGHVVRRDRLVALLWPEADQERARHLLADSIYVLRSALGEDVILGTGDGLHLSSARVVCDVVDFTRAFDAGDWTRAVDLYAGPFLDGFHIAKASEFEHWTDTTGDHLASQYRHALEQLAVAAGERGDRAAAVRWSRQLAAADRLSSRAALRLMHALADAGDRVGALRFAQAHEHLVRSELSTSPDEAITAFATELRAALRSADASPLPIASAAEIAAPGIAAPHATAPNEPATWTTRPGRRRPAFGLAATAAVLGLAALGYSAVDSRGTSRRAPGLSQPVREAEAHSPSIAAYELYVRGQDPLVFRSDSSLRAGIESLDRALALDPTYAEAEGALAYLCATAAWAAVHASTAERRRLYARAVSAAQRAVALNDRLAAAHRALGYVMMIGYDLPTATAELERAVALDPRSAAREDLAKAYEWSSRPSDGLLQAESAVRAAPLSASARAELGSALFFARRYGEAITQLAQVENLHPPLRRVPRYLAQVYAATGRWPETIAVLRADTLAMERSPGLLGYALARSGESAEAAELLRRLLGRDAESGHAFDVAEIYFGLGESEEAFHWLDRAFDDYSLTPSIMGPLFDEWRSDPRFGRIRRRLATEHGAGPSSSHGDVR